MEKLKTFIKKLESKIEHNELVNSEISSSSVGWRIEHSFLVINVIIEGLKNSNRKEYKRKFNLKRLFVYTINKIPRGKGKAPNRVQPKNDFTKTSLKNHFVTTNDKLKELDNLNSKQYIKHPVFGDLSLKHAIKFLLIHTKHRVDIIDDIIKKET